MSGLSHIQFAIPGKCRFEMSLDETRRTQRMIAEEQRNSGFYEGAYTIFVAALLKPGDIVVDVGAHVGYFTLLSASIVGPTGHVYAFEPAPDNFEALQTNVSLNGFDNVTLIPSAVGDKSGSVVLHYNSDNDGGHAVWDVRRFAENVISQRENRQFEVPITSLDAFFEDNTSRIKFVKIDVEGSELQVLNGAQNVVNTNGVDWFMWERNETAFEKMGYNEDDFRRRAAEMGYGTCGFIDGNLKKLSPAEHIYPGCETNLFLYKNQGADNR